MFAKPLRLLTLAAALAVAATGFAAADPLTIFAAASLKNALDDANKGYAGDAVTVSYAASGPLVKQIEAGAPADVFISADLEWMDYLDKKNLLKPGSRAVLLGNRLVLIAPKASKAEIKLGPDAPLATLLGTDKLAIGEPASVPAGKYAKTAFENLGLWASLQGRLAPVESVRAALALVSRNEAPLGVVYETDATVDPGVRIVTPFPDGSYPPVVYPIAAVGASKNPDAVKYIAYLRGPAASAIFKKYGFILPQ